MNRTFIDRNRIKQAIAKRTRPRLHPNADRPIEFHTGYSYWTCTQCGYVNVEVQYCGACGTKNSSRDVPSTDKKTFNNDRV